MPRPKVPLISRRKVLTAALAIIDAEGLDALRIRRLGEVLGVSGASVYYHVRNKEDILVGAASLALQYVRTPEAAVEPWPVWMRRNTYRIREALLDHPNLIPVVLERAPLGIGTRMLESTAALLVEQGVPVGYVMPLFESLEMVAVSSAMYTRRIGELGGVVLGEEYPLLLEATSKRVRAEVQLFEETCAAIISSMEKIIDDANAATTTRKRRAGLRS